jgi:hypothetical protein
VPQHLSAVTYAHVLLSPSASWAESLVSCRPCRTVSSLEGDGMREGGRSTSYQLVVRRVSRSGLDFLPTDPDHIVFITVKETCMHLCVVIQWSRGLETMVSPATLRLPVDSRFPSFFAYGNTVTGVCPCNISSKVTENSSTR